MGYIHPKKISVCVYNIGCKFCPTPQNKKNFPFENTLDKNSSYWKSSYIYIYIYIYTHTHTAGKVSNGFLLLFMWLG